MNTGTRCKVQGTRCKVHGTGCTMLTPPTTTTTILPLGVASTLRRVKSKAPALQYRAESPAINSTGQRPVVFGRKCRPCAVRHNMLVENTNPHPSPRSVRNGMWVEKRNRYNISGNTFRPVRDGWRNCTGYFVFYQHIVPTAQRLHFPPLGVASTLRWTCRDAMHCVSTMQRRAESPAINSTGQRPVWKGHSVINKPHRGGIKSNNRISPRKGEISVARRFNAGYETVSSPPERRSPDLFLYTPHETNRTRLPDKIYRGFAAGGFIADLVPALKHRATDISPFQGYGYGSPLFTGRCPVLMITGLSALQCKAGALLLTRRSVDATPSRVGGDASYTTAAMHHPQPRRCIVHNRGDASCTLHPAPCTLYRTSCTLHRTSCTKQNDNHLKK
jgi:hypothetical protein